MVSADRQHTEETAMAATVWTWTCGCGCGATRKVEILRPLPDLEGLPKMMVRGEDGVEFIAAAEDLTAD
jgi:hypothetical protein